MELVSIVVCTYNGEKFLEEQLQSIVGQTYLKKEVVIVDDGSTDTTVAIAKRYEALYDYIVVHDFKENVGYIKNFERGIALSRGDYIALSDQDDWWVPTKIERLMDTISESDLVYCDSIFVDENLRKIGVRFSQKKNMIASSNPLHFLLENCVSGHACLFKRKLYEASIPFPVYTPHDWWLAYNATLGKGISYLNEALVYYRHHDSNVIVSKNRVKKTKAQKKYEKQCRMENFYLKCPDTFMKEKQIISTMNSAYNNTGLLSNFKRLITVFKNRKEMLKISVKGDFQKIILMVNLFFTLK